MTGSWRVYMYLTLLVGNHGASKNVHIGKVSKILATCSIVLVLILTKTIGTEFQGWLLWYSLPILDGFLPDAYYQHYAQLVAGIGLLLSSNIKEDHLERAEELLEDFCRQIASLYGG